MEINRFILTFELSLLNSWKTNSGYLGNKFDLHAKFMNHLNKYNRCP